MDKAVLQLPMWRERAGEGGRERESATWREVDRSEDVGLGSAHKKSSSLLKGPSHILLNARGRAACVWAYHTKQLSRQDPCLRLQWPAAVCRWHAMQPGQVGETWRRDAPPGALAASHHRLRGLAASASACISTRQKSKMSRASRNLCTGSTLEHPHKKPHTACTSILLCFGLHSSRITTEAPDLTALRPASRGNGLSIIAGSLGIGRQRRRGFHCKQPVAG